MTTRSEGRAVGASGVGKRNGKSGRQQIQGVSGRCKGSDHGSTAAPQFSLDTSHKKKIMSKLHKREGMTRSR